MTAAISDETLVLYHYRDGLDADALAALDAAIAASPELAARYAALRATLANADAAFVAAEPDAAFEDRLWQGMQSRLPRPQLRETIASRIAAWWREHQRAIRPLALTFVLCAVFGAGLLFGRHDQAPSADVAALDDAAAQRVLAAYLARHLESTERLFLVAQNDGDDAQAQLIAAELAAANRLYAAAAERAGRPQLARFLREIEPVLHELAEPAGTDASALQAEIRDRDLPFKARAAAQIARRTAPLPGRTTSS
jgi:hypothetical protein